MRKAITFAIFLLMLTSWLNCTPQCMDLDIMIVGDFSGSVQGHERYVIDAFNSFAGIVNEEKNIRVGLILFADHPVTVMNLSKNIDSLILCTQRLREPTASGSTDIHSAIQKAANNLYAQDNNSRKLIILISDGQITSGGNEAQTIATAHSLSILGIGICSVLIKSASSQPEFMRQVASGCYVESDYKNLTAELSKLDICL